MDASHAARLDGATAAGALPPIVGFTPNHWDYGWSSRRRILHGLAQRGWPAFYSSGAHSVWDIGSTAWRAAPLTHKVQSEAGLLYDTAGKLNLRWTGRAWDRLTLAGYARHLRRALRLSAQAPAVAMLFHPAFWPYVRQLKPAMVVYYAYDAHSMAPGYTPQLARFERELVDSAALVLAFSRGMLEALPVAGASRGRVLPTGVDVTLFEAADRQPCPPDLADIPGPRIGYAGRINQKLDFALLHELATARPDWQWVFVGDVGAGSDGCFVTDQAAESLWQRCRALPNVHALGKKPHAQIPAYLRHMDVNVMCYRTGDDGWWSRIFPLKSMEYLACGQPVVSTPVTSMLPFKREMAIAVSPGEWLGAIDGALTDGGVGSRQSRRDCARRNSWDQRVDQLHTWLLEALAENGVAAVLQN